MTTGDAFPWASEWWDRAGWPEYALFFGLLALGTLFILWIYHRSRLKSSAPRDGDKPSV